MAGTSRQRRRLIFDIDASRLALEPFIIGPATPCQCRPSRNGKPRRARRMHSAARAVRGNETMPYKGGDLDLRSASPTFADAWGRGATADSHPIAVDELVLACCNRAYDVAHFHGSADVRLDHLLHALT